MEASRRIRVRALIIGLVLGVLLFALALLLVTRTAPTPELRDLFEEGIELPRDAYELERVRMGTGVRVELRDVALLDERGDTVLGAPTVRFRYRPAPDEEGVLLALDDVLFERPRVFLEERPDGRWNFAQAVRMEVAGVPVDAPGRQIVLRNVRIEDGHIVVATQPADGPARFAAFGEPAVFRGRSVRRQTVAGVNAVLPEVRLGGAPGWQVEVARFSARLPEQDIGIRQLAGVFGGIPDGGVRLGLRELRTDRSLVTGEGDMRLTDAGPAFSLSLTAAPLDFGDLRWMFPDVPEGTARFDAVIESAPGSPTRLAFTNLEAVADGSRVAGRTTIVLRPGVAEPVFHDTDLVLDPLRLELLERLGLAEELPLLGEIRGTVATAAPGTVESAALRLDLEAEIFPRADPAATSSIGAIGALQILGDAPWVRLDGVRLDFAPLDLRTVRALLDDPPDLLRGVIRGGVQAQGTLDDVRLVDGDLTYVVGDAPPTRLTGLSGRVWRVDGTLAYDLDATAAPLALATLIELVPALPLQPTALAGPISVSGVGERMSIVADLRGDAGGLDLRADLVLTDPLRFDVAAEVRAFQPQVLITRDLPVGVPLTGRIAARGTTADFAFDVDLRQPEGRVVLTGRFRPGVDPDRIEVAGRVENFRIGALFGRPGLFPGPMSGPIRIVAAGDLLYRVDVDLVGEGSRLRLDGWWRATAVPTYAFQGEVLGLDLARLPWVDGLPRSRVAASFAIDARGTTLETFAGRFDIDADGSVIEGDRVRQARLRGAVADGILRLDEGVLVHRDVRIEATGMLGLTRPAPEQLHFELDARDLSTLAAFLPLDVDETEMSGQLAMSGRIGGTLDAPQIDVDVSGRAVRYRGFRARELDAQVVLTRLRTGWRGGVALVAREAVLAGLPGEERFPTIRFDAEIREDQVVLAGFAERADDVDVSLSATAEIDDLLLRGIALESMLLRFGEVRWQLVEPAAIRWAGVDGMVVDGLRLRRIGELPGEIVIDGRIPDQGEADFEVRLVNLSLEDARVLYPALPDMEGVLNLEAHVRGPVTAPRADLTIEVTDLRMGEEARADRIRFEGVLADGTLAGTAFTELDQMQVLAAELELPVELDLSGLAPSVTVPEEGAVTAEILLANLPLDLVAEMSPGISEGAGFLAGEVTVGGVVARPVVDGWVTIEQGALRVEPLGLRYTEIEGRLALDDRRLEIEHFVARSGGLLELDGVVLIEELERPVFGLTARLDGFRAFDLPDLGRVAASGRLTLTGQAPAPVVRGQVVVEEARIEIPPLAEPALVRIEHAEIGQIGPDTIPGVVREPPIPVFFRDLRIDGVEVEVGHDVWLTSDDARIQLDGEVVVFRERDDLRLFGELEATRGTYTLRIGPITRIFDIERGQIQFAGTPDINPTLDITAVHEVRNLAAPGMGSTLRIIVELTGTARFPELALTSDSRPPLPETELFSFLIFGRPSYQLGTVVGGQLAQDILLQEVLGGIVATQVEEFLMRDLGLPLDYVRVHTRPTRITDPFGQTVIEAGVQIGRDLFFTTEVGFGGLFAGAAPTWGAGLEWEIDRYWTWRVAYEPLVRDRGRIGVLPLNVTHQFTTDIRRRWEFGHPDEEVADVAPIEPADDLAPDPREQIGDPLPEPEPAPRVPPTPPGASEEGAPRDDD